MTKEEVYAGLSSKEAKLAAIEGAGTFEELGTMWAVWESQGYTKQGVMYSRLLRAKQRFGKNLTNDEGALVEDIEARAAAGNLLPPISGGMKVNVRDIRVDPS